MKVLVKGDWAQAKQIFPKDTTFITGEVGDIPPYDAVFLGHYLQTLEHERVIPALEEFYNKLINNGEIWITTPSLDWIAREIVVKDEPMVLVPFMLYGSSKEPYRTGFTLLWLRVVVQSAKFIVRKAIQEVFNIGIDGGERYQAVQNLVIGLKHESS